jgi:hypothetical protein
MAGRRFTPSAYFRPIDALLFGGHTRLVRSVGLAVIASCVFVLAACTSGSESPSRSCPGKCPPPSAPSTTIHLSVASHSFLLRVGESHSVTLTLGESIPIVVSIASPTGATVSDVYLAVNSYPSGLNSGVPSGKLKILSSHVGTLNQGQPVATTWTPGPLFGTNSLDLTLAYTVGDSG